MKPFHLPRLAAALIMASTTASAMEVEVTPLPRILPDGIVAEGRNDILTAWLSTPTERYAHGALGDTIEAAGISVVLKDGTRLTLELPENAVFEDRYPRLVDLDRDGRDEMVVVKSTLSQGAALVIIGVREGQLQILAQSKPIGRANRWLNPVGVGDFDADGQIELAYVETPHIGGTLRILRWQDDQLVEVYAEYGFSNHLIGTPEMGLATVLDTNGDGVTDLVVPNTSRRILRVVTFKGGTFKELAQVPLSAPVLRLMTQYKDLKALIAVLANGRTAGVRFK
ncbi:MAG: VCBS repeat-containing protein [Magnetovibrio sp.]|nr:VCBS repeat-containing protein [Magnetovibrio sp.]